MFKEDILQNYVDTALERHRIYVKKEAGLPKPWTGDKVYQQFFFCNLFRQYDKCSKWIIDNVVPYERWDMIILYRFISTYELFEEIKANCKLDDFKGIQKFLGAKRDRGESLFDGCFLRNPRIQGGWTETYNVPFYVTDLLREDADNLKYVIGLNSIEQLVHYLKQFPGIGGFMGYEYACDMEYTSWFNPTDKYTWANMGPGAMRGMSLIMHGVPGKKMTQSEWLIGARELFKILKQEVNKHFPNEDVSMREVEHWLCEYQKYRKYWGVLNLGHKVKYRIYGGMA